MIFSCGENWEARHKRLEDWHDFFALVPRTVKVENGKDICAWLQTIERKGKHSFIPYHGGVWNWSYRLKGEPNG